MLLCPSYPNDALYIIVVTSFILDAEIVAWDTKLECTRSFQDLSNRPRKDVKPHDIKIPVCLFVFDLIYINDEVSAHILTPFHLLTVNLIYAISDCMPHSPFSRLHFANAVDVYARSLSLA